MTSWSDRKLGARLFATGPPSDPGRHVERLRLPVPVRGRANPDGVPLAELLAAAQAVLSTVEGAAATGAELTLICTAEPTAAQRRRLRKLLDDREKLLALAEPPAAARSSDDAEPPAARSSDDAGPPAAADGAALRELLRDESTPDAQWLRAFRRWAVSELIPPDGSA
jgi:hypothetical protein